MNTQVISSPYVVTAAEMRAIESRLFEAGIPVAALMEKVGQLLTCQITHLFPVEKFSTASILIGPGHNGGDALVVARELWELGYIVKLYRPLSQAKPLTTAHLNYAQHLGLIPVSNLEDWLKTDFIIDGLFGFGLERPIQGELAETLNQINAASTPVVSIDIPSGLHTDTGEILGTAIAADHTFCLGLWKRAFFQEQALGHIGHADLISFGIPHSDQTAILGDYPSPQVLSQPDLAPILERAPAMHKYDLGATLLICGSSAYPGAAILSAQAARATGVGMLYVSVPESIRDLVIAQVPEAVVIACPENSSGAIAELPPSLNLDKITAVAIGPGLTTDASKVVQQSLDWDLPLILDADALNILAKLDWQALLNQRQAPTLLTPHWGEFQRLFPDAMSTPAAQNGDRLTLLSDMVYPSQITLILKGAKTLIAGASLRINAESTPALARGGSGDVLTGVLAGLAAQNLDVSSEQLAGIAVWWHAHAALLAEQDRTSAGVHPTTLIQTLIPYLRTLQNA